MIFPNELPLPQVGIDRIVAQVGSEGKLGSTAPCRLEHARNSESGYEVIGRKLPIAQHRQMVPWTSDQGGRVPLRAGGCGRQSSLTQRSLAELAQDVLRDLQQVLVEVDVLPLLSRYPNLRASWQRHIRLAIELEPQA